MQAPLPPVMRTQEQARDYFSHFPLIEAKAKLYRVVSVRGEGARATLDAAAARLTGEGWPAQVFTDVTGRTSLSVSLKDRTVGDISLIMRRFANGDLGSIEADPQLVANPAALATDTPSLVFP